MTDPTPSAESQRLRRADARLALYWKWISRVAPALFGGGITLWCLHHIIKETGETPEPSVTHILIVALFGVIGLCIAGGKRTIDGLSAITGGIRAWRGKDDTP